MSERTSLHLCVGILALVLTGCGEESTLPKGADTGKNPVIAKPVEGTIPTVKIAPAKGWPSDQGPAAANGLTANAFARDLNHPRSILILPNGDVLVAESNAPPKQQSTGLKGLVMQFVMWRAGAGVESPNRVVLLRDTNGDGTADLKTNYIEGLFSPFGLSDISTCETKLAA